jgi:hypothetical protein
MVLAAAAVERAVEAQEVILPAMSRQSHGYKPPTSSSCFCDHVVPGFSSFTLRIGLARTGLAYDLRTHSQRVPSESWAVSRRTTS